MLITSLVAFFVNLFINIALKRLQLLCSICERVSPLCQQLLIGYIYLTVISLNSDIPNSQPQPRKFQTSNIQQYIRKPFNPRLLYPCFCLFFCLLMWWAGNCSITESLPELIQQVRQGLAGAPGGQP